MQYNVFAVIGLVVLIILFAVLLKRDKDGKKSSMKLTAKQTVFIMIGAVLVVLLMFWGLYNFAFGSVPTPI